MAARRLRERLNRAVNRRKDALKSFRCPVHGQPPSVIDGPTSAVFEIATCCRDFEERIRSLLPHLVRS